MPLVDGLRTMLVETADRIARRAENFESRSDHLEPYMRPPSKKVFIIHGHDEAKWRELQDILRDKLKLETIELGQKAGIGRTIIEKFEDFGMICGYAFALLTPDDFVEKEEASYRQARPNVLFELGWFYGRYGRNRACILCKTGTSIPSDLQGIGRIEFGESVEESFLDIQRELKRVGMVG